MYKTELRLDEETRLKLQDIRQFINDLPDNKLSNTKISMASTLRYCINYVWAHLLHDAGPADTTPRTHDAPDPDWERRWDKNKQ